MISSNWIITTYQFSRAPRHRLCLKCAHAGPWPISVWPALRARVLPNLNPSGTAASGAYCLERTQVGLWHEVTD